MLKLLFKRIKRAFYSLFVAAATTKVVTSEKEELPIEKPVEQEAKWFTRVNDLVNEFAYDPIPVYGSDLTSHVDAQGKVIEPKPIGYLNSNGIMFATKEGALGKIKEDSIELEKEELLEDDVALLKDKFLPNRNQSTTHNL